MRDRIVALSMRKATRIRNEDFDLPMLTLDDFDIQPPPPKLVHILGKHTAAADVTKRTTLAELCIEKAKLCYCIGHVLAVQYCSRGESTVMLTSKGPACAAQLVQVIECEQELSQWYENLPRDCHYRMSGSNERTNAHACKELSVHRAVLSMIYLTTVSALHRPQVLSELPSQSMARNLQQMSRQRVKGAAIKTTEIAHDLHDQDLTRFLPPTGVTVLIPAMVVQLLEIKSGNAAVYDSSSRRFRQCMQVLQRLREMYASADAAFFFLEAAKNKVDVQIPDEKEQREARFTSDLPDHNEAVTPWSDACTVQPGRKVRPSSDPIDDLPASTPLWSDGEPIWHLPETSAAGLGSSSRLEDVIEICGDIDGLIDSNAWSDFLMAEDCVMDSGFG